MADEDLNPVPQPDPDPGPAPDPVPAAPVGAARRCLVVDATPALQEWVDQFYALVPVVAGPDTDDPVELPEGTVVVTVAAVWQAVERAFSTEDDAWSIVESGLPVLGEAELISNGPASARNPIRDLICWLWRC